MLILNSLSEDISTKDKKKNEKCFHPSKERIEYNSVIITEIIRIDDFDKLINGLKDLYDNVDALDYRSIEEAERMINSQKNRLFKGGEAIILPFITNTKLGIVTWWRVNKDLGEYIDHLKIIIQGISPSNIILQVHALLNPKASDDLNEIIYRMHKTKSVPVKTTRGDYTSIHSPQKIKKDEISKLRNTIKNEITDFLSNYIKGYFINFEFEYSVVPSIDTFCFNFPKDPKELIKWGSYNKHFINCFSTNVSEMNSFRMDNYLFLNEEDSENKIVNQLIFANPVDSTPELLLKVRIVEELTHCSFGLLAIKRWIELQEYLVGKLNDIITSEINYLETNTIDNLLKKREVLYKEIFSFERFKIEIEKYIDLIDFCNFNSINGINLFENLKGDIKDRIELIDNLIHIYFKQSDSILNLKNIDYNAGIQNKILILTVIVAGMTLIQVYGVIRTSDMDNILANIIFQHIIDLMIIPVLFMNYIIKILAFFI